MHQYVGWKSQLHPSIDEYLTRESSRAVDYLRSYLVNTPCKKLSAIKECRKIDVSIKAIIIGMIINFNDFKRTDPKFEEDCLKNLIVFLKLVVKKGCLIDFDEGEISHLLKASQELSYSYYNLLTVSLYIVIFRLLESLLKRKHPGSYTNTMIHYLRKTKIFFTDSYIFDLNHFTLAGKYLRIKDFGTDLGAIYPYQEALGEMGLEANFISYFLYARFLLIHLLSLLIEIVDNPGIVRQFVYTFVYVMDHYVFIEDNLMACEENKVGEIYRRHYLTPMESKIMIGLIIVFLTEMQYILFGLRENDQECHYVSKILCQIFDVNSETGLRYWPYGWKENLKWNIKANDITSFTHILEKNIKEDDKLSEKMNQTADYLNILNLPKTFGVKCIRSMEMARDIFYLGTKVKEQYQEPTYYNLPQEEMIYHNLSEIEFGKQTNI